MADLGKFESLIPITATQTMSVTETTPNTGATNAAVAVADYYLTSSTALLTAVKTALDAVSGNSTYTVSLDDTNDSSTGKVTISAAGVVSFTIDWASATSLRDILGFTGNLSGAASYTGSNQALYLHLPGCGRSNAPNPIADDGMPVRDGNIVFAPGSDVTYAMSFVTRTRGMIEFQHLLGSNVWTSLEVVTNESLQTFWTYGPAKGYPVRWHSDRNVDGTYKTWRLTSAIREFAPVPVVGSWVGAKSLWRWSSDYVKYTT